MADDQDKEALADAPGTPTAGPDNGITKRQFFRSTMFSTIGMFFLTAAGGAGAMFWPIKLTGFGSTVPVPVKAGDVKVGDVIPVREGKFYLTRSEDGLMALYWRCVHLGCTVPWVQSENLFMCPCHGSHYTITGQNVAGPAPRPLDYMEMAVAGDGTISVNTGKVHQRSKYEPAQATKV